MGPAKFIWTATAWRSDGRATLAFVSKPLLVNTQRRSPKIRRKCRSGPTWSLWCLPAALARQGFDEARLRTSFQRLRSNGAEVRHWDSDSKSRLEHTGPAGRGLRGRIWHDHRPGVIQSNKQPATSVPPPSVPEDFNPLPPPSVFRADDFPAVALVRFLFRAFPIPRGSWRCHCGVLLRKSFGGRYMGNSRLDLVLPSAHDPAFA